MSIIIIPKKISKKVDSFEEIRFEAPRLQELIETSNFGPGYTKTSIALHHSQVHPDPFNFFVIKRSIVGAKDNEIVAFLNPQILEKDPATKTTSIEGCISFPFRPDKKVQRYDRIHVRYDVVGKDEKLEQREEWVEGIMARIFQHEVQHAKGCNIYQN